mgnify:CR=1 FL=1
MNRRRFLGSVFAITAALGVTRVPDSVQAASVDPIQARIDAVLANPEQYPEIMARAREYLGGDIAQARADGYNRGREVEEARQEARSEKQASA